MITRQQLAHAEAACKTAHGHAEKTRRQRDELIRTAIAQGWTHTQIAKATGLTRGRVAQIASNLR